MAAATSTCAAALAERGLELGRRLRCGDLRGRGAADARAGAASTSGRPAEGLALLDEAMLFVLDGRLVARTRPARCTAASSAPVSSSATSAAPPSGRGDRSVGRAAPVRRVPRACAVSTTPPRCSGAGSGSKPNARRPAPARSWPRSTCPNAAAAWAEIGDIRRRLGDLDAAEAAFVQRGSACAPTAPWARPPPPGAGPCRRRHVDHHRTRSTAPAGTASPAPSCCPPVPRSPSPPGTLTLGGRRRRGAGGDRRRVQQRRPAGSRGRSARGRVQLAERDAGRLRHPAHRRRALDRPRRPLRDRHRPHAARPGLPRSRRRHAGAVVGVRRRPPALRRPRRRASTPATRPTLARGVAACRPG